MKGIILIAIGNPYYGRLAYNLCISIKASEGIPVALIYDDSAVTHLSDEKKIFFDHLIKCPVEYKTQNGKNEWLKPKTFIDKLTPFDETIYLDSDMVWNPYKKPSELFDRFADVDFQIANRGYSKEVSGMAGFSLWADIAEIKQEHGISQYMDVSSEFIYFKSNDKAKEIFAQAQKIFETDRVTYRTFAGGKPDEPAFAIAIEQLNVSCETPFYPTFWHYHNVKRNVGRTEIVSNYYAISMGGAHLTTPMKQMYSDFTKSCFNLLGVGVPFPIESKSKILAERKTY